MIALLPAWKAITSPVGLMVIALLTFAGVLWYVYDEGKTNGASSVIEKQNEVNREVIRASRGARDNVDRCRAGGGMWSRETGTCSQ